MTKKMRRYHKASGRRERPPGPPRNRAPGIVRATRRRKGKKTADHESMGADILGDTPF